MRHEEWVELIPLYLAHRLSPVEKAAFEAYLANCPSCQDEIDEWRTIASVVWSQAEAWSRSLPPLSVSVRSQLGVTNSPNGYQKTQVMNMHPVDARTIQTRVGQFQSRHRLPWALAAAVLMMAVFGGLFIILALRNADSKENIRTVGLAPGQSTRTPSGPTATYTLFGVPEITPEATNSKVGIGGGPQVVSPIDDTDLNMFPPPGSTEIPIDPLVTDDSQVTTMLSTICTASSATGADLPIYPWPDLVFEPIDSLKIDEPRQAIVQSGTGWVEVLGIGGTIGWVKADQVQLSGTCELPLPTPTLPESSVSGCSLSPGTTQSIFIYRSPASTSDIVGVVRPGESFSTSVVTSDNWFQLVNPPNGILGWVFGGDIQLSPNCDRSILITPTSVPSTPSSAACLVTSISGEVLNIRATPDEQADILNAFLGPLLAIARSDNGWYQIQHVLGSTTWIGWVPATSVTTTDSCQTLPISR